MNKVRLLSSRLMRITLLLVGLVCVVSMLPPQADSAAPTEAGLIPFNRSFVPEAGTSGETGLRSSQAVTSSLKLDWLPDPDDLPPSVVKAPVNYSSDASSKATVHPASYFNDYFYQDPYLNAASGGVPSIVPRFTQPELGLGSRGYSYCPQGSNLVHSFCRARYGNSSGGSSTNPILQRNSRREILIQAILVLLWARSRGRNFQVGQSDELSAGVNNQNLNALSTELERERLRRILSPLGPTVGRTLTPQAGLPQFDNPFRAGANPNDLTLLPLNQAVLSDSSLPSSVLSPQFRNNLDGYFSWPAASTEPLPGQTIQPPSAPQNAPCLVQSPLSTTYVTFVNTSSRYISIFWVDFTCQEVQYAVIPPNTIYYQPSYFNYAWRVRDALTAQYVGQVVPTAALPQPVFYVYDLRSGQEGNLASEVTAANSATPESSVGTSQGVLPSLAQIEAQYQSLGDRQLDRYYSDSSLAALRVERVRLLLYFLYTDPLYTYVRYELDNIYRQIYITRPSYATVINLANEIDSWTTPPADAATARSRFIKRQALALWQDQLENEVALFMQANPALAQQLSDIESWLLERFDAIMSSDTVRNYAADWLQRYADTYDASLSPLQPEINQLMAANPKFEEYVQVRDEIENLLPQFESHPVVNNIVQQYFALDNNPVLTQAINQAYADYLVEISNVLDQTTFDEESESFYAQLNYLVKSDPDYQQLATRYINAIQALQIQLQSIHTAVANCFALYGNFCNPYTDPAVQAALNPNNLWQLLGPVGQTYEDYNEYWYTFYQGEAYLNLQFGAQSRIQAAQAQILPVFEAARERFKQRVNAISQVQQLQTSIQQASPVLRGQTPFGSADNVETAAAYPYAELDQKLKRLEQLGIELTSEQAEVYLPLILR